MCVFYITLSVSLTQKGENQNKRGGWYISGCFVEGRAFSVLCPVIMISSLLFVALCSCALASAEPQFNNIFRGNGRPQFFGGSGNRFQPATTFSRPVQSAPSFSSRPISSGPVSSGPVSRPVSSSGGGGSTVDYQGRSYVLSW